jgi:hypothetical protein
MAEVFEARGIVSGAHEEEDGRAEDEGVEGAAGGSLRSRPIRCFRPPALSG